MLEELWPRWGRWIYTGLVVLVVGAIGVFCLQQIGGFGKDIYSEVHGWFSRAAPSPPPTSAPLTVTRPAECPLGYTIIADSEFSGAFSAGISLPEGARICIVRARIHDTHGPGIDVREKSSTRLTFQQDVAEQLVSRLPAGKAVRLISVGSSNDQLVGDQYQQFLQDRGVKIESRTRAGVIIPPADFPIFINVVGDIAIVTITPGAR